MIGIRCERGSHRFFKKYGERFEDSEGKQIFLEFADEEKEHLELLIREYRELMKRTPRERAARRTGRHAVAARPTRDRPPPPYTASDGLLCSGAARRRASPRRASPPAASPITTPSPASTRPRRRPRACGLRFVPGHRDHRGRRTAATCTCSATASTRARRALETFLAAQRGERPTARAPHPRSAGRARHAARRSGRSWPVMPRAAAVRRRPARSAGRTSRGDGRRRLRGGRRARHSTRWLGIGPARVRAARRRVAGRGRRDHPARGRSRGDGASGADEARRR